MGGVALAAGSVLLIVAAHWFIDAKYKRLINTRDRPNGVDQSDLYQLVAYAMRFTPTTVSALVYPHSPDEHDVALSTAESLGPWQSDEQTLAFQRLPTSINECRAALTALLASQGEIAPSVSFG